MLNNYSNYANWKFDQMFSKLRKHHEMILKEYDDFFNFAVNHHLAPSITLNWLEDKQEESETANTQVEVNDDFSDSNKQLAKAHPKCQKTINRVKNVFRGIKESSFLNNAHKAFNDEVTEVGEPCSKDEIDCFAFMDDDMRKAIDPSYKTCKEQRIENDREREAERRKRINEKLEAISITKKAVINDAVTKVSRALRNMIRSDKWKNRYKDETKENKRLAITALLIKSIFYLFNSCNMQGSIFKDGDIADKDLIRLTNDIILNDEVGKVLFDIRAVIGRIGHVLSSKNHLTQHSYIEELDGLNVDNITKLSYTFIVGNNAFEISFNSKYPKKTCDIEIKATDNSLPIKINSNTSFEDLFRYILENSKFRTNIIN